MGYLQDWLFKRYGDKWWIHLLKLMTDVILILVFVYMTLTVRGWMLKCTCPRECKGTECVQLVKACIRPVEGLDVYGTTGTGATVTIP